MTQSNEQNKVLENDLKQIRVLQIKTTKKFSIIAIRKQSTTEHKKLDEIMMHEQNENINKKKRQKKNQKKF